MNLYIVGEVLLVLLILALLGSLIQGIKISPLTGALQMAVYLSGIVVLFALGFLASLVVGAPNAKLMCAVTLVSGCSRPLPGLHFLSLPVSLGTIFAMSPFISTLLAKFLAEVVSKPKPAQPRPTPVLNTPQARSELAWRRSIRAFTQDRLIWFSAAGEALINMARAKVAGLGIPEFGTAVVLSFFVIAVVVWIARIMARLWKSSEVVWNGPSSPHNLVGELVTVLERMGELGQTGWRQLARWVGERYVQGKRTRTRRQRELEIRKREMENEKRLVNEWENRDDS